MAHATRCLCDEHAIMQFCRLSDEFCLPRRLRFLLRPNIDGTKVFSSPFPFSFFHADRLCTEAAQIKRQRDGLSFHAAIVRCLSQTWRDELNETCEFGAESCQNFHRLANTTRRVTAKLSAIFISKLHPRNDLAQIFLTLAWALPKQIKNANSAPEQVIASACVICSDFV